MRSKTLLLIVFMCLVSEALTAHPPDKISLEFNAETHILKVVIHHHVEDAVKHIVQKITVKINGKEAVTQKFQKQLNQEKQEAVFLIPGAVSGDEIEVTGNCNVFGKKKENYKIP